MSMTHRVSGSASRPQVRRSEGGYCIEGPGFYVWDESRREVERVARELFEGRIPDLPTERFLVVERTNPPLAGEAR